MKVHSIKYNAIFNMIYTLSNIIFPLITFPYVSRVLMASGNGKVNFFNSIATYGTTIASLGLSTYGIRAVARVRDDKKRLSKLTVELLLINTIGTVIVVGFLIGSVFFVSKFRQENALFIITIMTIVLSVIGMSWLFSGLEQYDYITKRSVLFKFISLIMVFVFVKGENDYIKYALIMMFSTVGSYVLNFFYSMKFVDYRVSIHKINIKPHIKPTLILFSSILAVSVYTNLDTVMLGFYSGDREVGLYTVAVKVEWLLLMLINALSTVLLPRLSKHVEEKNMGMFNTLNRESIKIVFFVSVPLTIFFIVMAKETIWTIGGTDYLSAVLCMQILMPVLVISGFSNVVGNQILIPMGRDKSFLYAVSSGAVLNLIANIILLPKYGANGAAFSTIVAEVTQMSIQLYFGRKIIKGNVNIFEVFKFLISSVIAGVSVIILQKNIVINPFVGLIIGSMEFGIVYIICLILFRDDFIFEVFNGLKEKLK